METAIKTIGSSSSVRARTGRCATLRARRPVPLLEYDYLTTHQPGAQHALYSFLSGLPFTRGIRSTYASLDLPVWMAHGVRGDFTDYGGKSAVEGKTNWTIQEFPTGALPHFEVLDKFVRAYDAFLLRTG